MKCILEKSTLSEVTCLFSEWAETYVEKEVLVFGCNIIKQKSLPAILKCIIMPLGLDATMKTKFWQLCHYFVLHTHL